MLAATLLILVGGADLARSRIVAPIGRVLVAGVIWIAVVVLAAVGLGVPGYRTSLDLNGFIVEWQGGVVSTVLGALPLTAIAVAIGVALFATESANLIVRAALRPTTPAPAPGPVPVSRSPWWRRASTPTPAIADLRGGRLIGPIERVLIIGLTLGGALPIVAGLIAAKGIVRFPEISNDGANGSKAEYVLVGSLVSWTIAVAGAALIRISVAG